jgi:hypothetical protein
VGRKKKSESRQARQFGVALSVLATLFAAGFYFIGGHPVRAGIAVAVAALALLMTFLAFPLWIRFFRQWMKFAQFMGMVVSTIILTVFYYLFFTPIVLLVRLFGSGLLDLRWKDGRPTYWIDKPEIPATLERYEKQF